MSENITHTAVTDDCARLCLASADICAPFKESLEAHLEAARLGGVTRSGGKFMPSLLEEYRRRWRENGGDDGLRQKLAFLLGWHFHRAADLQMKPVFRTVDPDCPRSPTDCSIYHDVFLFREVYECGGREPYSTETLTTRLSGDGVDLAQLEAQLRTLWQRALIGIHTFIPDQSNADGWIQRLLKTTQRFTVDLGRYAEALASPDPAKTKRFIEEVNFYDGRDPLITWARTLQTGAASPAVSLDEALAQAAAQSQYAQALRRGYLYVRAASDYFRGEADIEAYKDALERGKQGIT